MRHLRICIEAICVLTAALCGACLAGLFLDGLVPAGALPPLSLAISFLLAIWRAVELSYLEEKNRQ